ncbi:hypothetical protein NAT51_03280 [Flavobacterium amniphilum]|uniref:hypothetical protein n=1 Tax=Flavobacterium amniphilum TaxID=1834035 RepID=UPI00202A918D|nr:hypothetical protein [Flavobacterium amniphilum]MCL9804528.1 hypothetical protein [Flavobacterium amniphilum]
MKKILLLFIFFCFLSVHSQQNELAIQKLLSEEIKGLIGDEHGVHYMYRNKMVPEEKVKQELEHIKSISLLDLKKYKVDTIQKGNHIVKIIKAIGKNTNVEKLIEIKSVYTTFNNKSQFYNFNYYIVSKSKPSHISLSFNENGIYSYTVNGKEISTSREMIIVYDDNISEIDTSEKKMIYSEANKTHDVFLSEIEALTQQYFR